jgi:hypothetical protein
MKDGTKRKFPHEGRSGGSYTKRLTFKEDFVVITDEWDKSIFIPVSDIAEIEETSERY